jgi:hypothetical protein
MGILFVLIRTNLAPERNFLPITQEIEDLGSCERIGPDALVEKLIRYVEKCEQDGAAHRGPCGLDKVEDQYSTFIINR